MFKHQFGLKSHGCSKKNCPLAVETNVHLFLTSCNNNATLATMSLSPCSGLGLDFEPHRSGDSPAACAMKPGSKRALCYTNPCLIQNPKKHPETSKDRSSQLSRHSLLMASNRNLKQFLRIPSISFQLVHFKTRCQKKLLACFVLFVFRHQTGKDSTWFNHLNYHCRRILQFHPDVIKLSHRAAITSNGQGGYLHSRWPPLQTRMQNLSIIHRQASFLLRQQNLANWKKGGQRNVKELKKTGTKSNRTRMKSLRNWQACSL